MYTALEVNRAYHILGVVLVYRERVFEEDHPPSFIFTRADTGEQVAYFLEQLTHYEETGQLQYLGLIPESMR
jgi:hypothetical protein